MAASVCLEHSPSCSLCWPTTASKGDKAVMQGTILSCEADSGANVLITRFPARSKSHIEDFCALNSFIHRLCWLLSKDISRPKRDQDLDPP